MKALILGAGGQVGRALVATAPARCALDTPARAELDIAHGDALTRRLSSQHFDIVFNAAAYTQVDEAERNPDAAHRVNALAVGALAKATRASGARLVHISSDFVFDGTSARPYRPDDATNPINAYGRSKRDGEVLALQEDPAVLILRTSWVYAAEGRNFVNTMLRLMRSGQAVRVVSDQVGTPTHATRVAQALWALAEQRAEGILHYSDAGVASWYDFAVAIQEEALARGLLNTAVSITPVRSAEFPTPARRPHYSVLDSRSSWDRIGRPPPHWRASLRDALSAMAS